MNPSPGGDQVQKLRATNAKLKKVGITRGSVVTSFIGRRVQPLQKRAHPGFRYEGPNDPSRFIPDELRPCEIFKRTCQVLDDV